MNERIHKYTLTSAATDQTDAFAVAKGLVCWIDVFVAATSSPTGTLTLQRYKNGSWQTQDLGDESFTDPAAGAADSEVILRNLPPGKYRVLYTSSSGGAAGGITVEVRIGPTP